MNLNNTLNVPNTDRVQLDSAALVAEASDDRYYQSEAVAAFHAGFQTGDRGQLHMACGTGKTRVYMRIAARVCPGGLVVVLAPSVWLLGQIVQEWRADFGHDHEAMAVCHDSTVADDPAGYGIAVPVTTKQHEVNTWLGRNRASGVTRLVVATHRSVSVVGKALKHADLSADLLILDEAHHSAGRTDKLVACAHDNRTFPAIRRLYGTASPVQLSESRRRTATTSAGMDDEALFGPVQYSYPLSQGIADGYLDDYRIVVVGVSDGETRRVLTRHRASPAEQDSPIDLHTAMCQIVVAKAAARFDLRRVIVFNPSVDDAIQFAETLPATVSMMGDDRPKRPLTSSFVHGDMKIRERNQRLDLLRDPPGDAWVTLANKKVLGEGINVPGVDGIMFTYPKKSPVEIVQAIGRATRRNPAGSGVSTIILPLAVPDAPDDDIDLDSLTTGQYQVLWEVLSGLRQHDAAFERELGRLRTDGHTDTGVIRRPRSKLEVHLPEGWKPMEFLQQLAIRVAATTPSVWWDSMDALRAFHAEHGHTDVVAGTMFNGVDLFSWTTTNRNTYRRGAMLDDRDAALREVGFDPDGDAVSWARHFRAACAFHAQYGHLEPPEGMTLDGVTVQAWLDAQRDLYAVGHLSDLRRGRLDSVGMRWTRRPRTQQEHLDALAAYHQQHGNIDIAPDPVSDEGYLGQWLAAQRLERDKGTIEDWIGHGLDELDMNWDPPTPVRKFAKQVEG